MVCLARKTDRSAGGTLFFRLKSEKYCGKQVVDFHSPPPPPYYANGLLPSCMCKRGEGFQKEKEFPFSFHCMGEGGREGPRLLERREGLARS